MKYFSLMYFGKQLKAINIPSDSSLRQGPVTFTSFESGKHLNEKGRKEKELTALTLALFSC